jgi:hypothetical protein
MSVIRHVPIEPELAWLSWPGPWEIEMSVVVFVKSTPAFSGDETPRAELFGDESEGCYWALEPVFRRIEEHCGLFIDEYDTAAFPPDRVGCLREELGRALKELAERPESWEVSTGTEVSPNPRELVQRVLRSDVLGVIEQMKALADEAIDSGAYLIFSGE